MLLGVYENDRWYFANSLKDFFYFANITKDDFLLESNCCVATKGDNTIIGLYDDFAIDYVKYHHIFEGELTYASVKKDTLILTEELKRIGALDKNDTTIGYIVTDGKTAYAIRPSGSFMEVKDFVTLGSFQSTSDFKIIYDSFSDLDAVERLKKTQEEFCKLYHRNPYPLYVYDTKEHITHQFLSENA